MMNMELMTCKETVIIYSILIHTSCIVDAGYLLIKEFCGLLLDQCYLLLRYEIFN